MFSSGFNYFISSFDLLVAPFAAFHFIVHDLLLKVFQIICSRVDQTSILQESKLVVQILESFLLSIYQEDFHPRNQGYFRIVSRNGASERLSWCFQDLWCFWTTLQDKPVPYQVSHSSYCSLGDLYCSPRWFILFTLSHTLTVHKEIKTKNPLVVVLQNFSQQIITTSQAFGIHSSATIDWSRIVEVRFINWPRLSNTIWL